MTKLPFLSVLFILWAGLILGVSFIATPVKFMAQHLTMPVALEIGKAHSYLRQQMRQNQQIIPIQRSREIADTTTHVLLFAHSNIVKSQNVQGRFSKLQRY
jgi:ABC-type transport system involved in multi-copper enzyme maturation permease subunit